MKHKVEFTIDIPENEIPDIDPVQMIMWVRNELTDNVTPLGNQFSHTTISDFKVTNVKLSIA